MRVDVPAPLCCKLKEQAARKGCSIRELVSRGIEQVPLEPRLPHKRVSLPLIRSKGPKIKLTSERIYELVEFP
jgi:hypothetical protein